MATKKEVNILYLCVHKRLCDKAGKGNLITKRELFNIIGKVYHIPRNLHYPVLQELTNLKLVEPFEKGNVLGRGNTLKVLECNIDLENTSKIYKKLNFF